jgi:phage replication initiation protein
MSIFKQIDKDRVSSIYPEKYKSVAPYNNMGGINSDTNFVSSLKAEKGKGRYSIIETPNRNINTDPNAAFIDWLNFTFSVDAFYKEFPFVDSISDSGLDIVVAISEKLHSIFGFGVTSKCDGGKNFYKDSYVLGDGWGFLCIGGYHQRNTCLIMLSGTGCTACRGRKWEKSIHGFLERVSGKITRVDCTADFFDGEYSLDMAEAQYMNGDFNNGGKEVSARQAGNWLKPDGTGRTLYIGKKENGKELCLYEKGLQLGGNFSTLFKNWVRVELRYGNKDRVIPLDILLFPGQYLSAGYKPLNFISKVQCRIKTVKAKVKVEYDKAKAVLKHQFGGLLFVIASVEGSIASVVRDDVPKRLIVPDFKNRILDDITKDDYALSEDYCLDMAFM